MDDNLSIGSRRSGSVLVCYGDDQPEELARWLQLLVIEFNRLNEFADDFGFQLDPADGRGVIGDVFEFCERVGVTFNSEMWEGECISGIYHWGWCEVGKARSSATHGRALLRVLRKQVDTEVKRIVFDDLAQIKDLDAFIERTADDRMDIKNQMSNLRASLAVAEADLTDARNNLKCLAENRSPQIDEACCRLIAELLRGNPSRVVAGPLVLWDDRVVYAICSWGESPIPKGSMPDLVLRALELSGQRVVKVSDRTKVRVGLSRLGLWKGSSELHEWVDIWAREAPYGRTFLVDPESMAEQVRDIHRILASK